MNDGVEGVMYWLRTIEFDLRRMYMLGTEPPPQRPHPEVVFEPMWGVNWEQSSAVDPLVEQRSATLFLMAAGKEAFDTLQAGKPLPITGSNGTQYTLHKRSTYCVKRVSDGARLCAVVPGVPLWDHLLGIKLMVENDEAKFLATANVAGDMSRALAETMRGCSEQLAQNVFTNNALLQRLTRGNVSA